MNVDTIVDGGVGMYRRATNLKNNTSTIATKKKSIHCLLIFLLVVCTVHIDA